MIKEPGRGDGGVGPEHVHQVVQQEVGDGEAVLDGLDAERRRKVALPHAGGPQEQHVGLLPDVAAGGQRLDLPAIHPGLERPVEVLERFALGQAGQLEHRLHPALVLALELAGEDQVEKGGGRQPLAGRLLEQLGQTRRRVIEPDAGELGRQRIQREEGTARPGRARVGPGPRCLGGSNRTHRATSSTRRR
jgi:hypothetical protein